MFKFHRYSFFPFGIIAWVAFPAKKNSVLIAESCRNSDCLPNWISMISQAHENSVGALFVNINEPNNSQFSFIVTSCVLSPLSSQQILQNPVGQENIECFYRKVPYFIGWYIEKTYLVNYICFCFCKYCTSTQKINLWKVISLLKICYFWMVFW